MTPSRITNQSETKQQSYPGKFHTLVALTDSIKLPQVAINNLQIHSINKQIPHWEELIRAY